MTLGIRTADKHTLSLFDEINLARLGLISMQSRVGPTAHSWEDEYIEGGRTVRMKCVGTVEYLIPHGIDSDIMIGIENMFLAARCPPSNSVTNTANGYLRWAGLDTSGRYHKGLHESLMRLSHSNFHIERNWHDGHRYRTVIFRHLHEIIYDTPESGGSFDRESRITVVLPAPIAESLRRGYIKPVDAGLLRALKQPSTRALFRLLDGSRYTPGQPDVRADVLQVNLIELGRKARILDLRPDKVRRTLESAHDELLKAHYLREVEYSGRGVNTSITYVFAHDIELADPQLFERLTARGISPKGSRDLISQYGNTTVRARMDEAEQLVAGKKSPGPGFFVNFIRKPEDYRNRAQSTSPKMSAGSTQPLLLTVPSRPVEEDPDVRQRRLWDSMTPQERAKDILRIVKFAYGQRLTPGQYEALREALEVEAVDGWELRAETGRMLNNHAKDQGALALIQRLEHLTRS